MGKGIALKTQNIPLILLFIAWCLTLYILFLVGFNDFWKEFIALFNQVNAKKGIFITTSPLISFVLSGFISSDLKANIVFWKMKNPLPGSRAFTEIGPNDPRVDAAVLKKKLKTIPSEPEDQNRVWYKIYKKVQGKKSVDLSHKNFLLARELAAISFLFLIFTPWSIVFLSKVKELSALYFLIMLLQYFVLCIVAQNNGRRFVGNVLAEYCYT